jgi:hypothetical protein
MSPTAKKEIKLWIIYAVLMVVIGAVIGIFALMS